MASLPRSTRAIDHRRHNNMDQSPTQPRAPDPANPPPQGRPKARRKSARRRVEFLLTLSDFAAIARAAAMDGCRIGPWIRGCAVRAATRSDVAVRGAARRMAARDAELVRICIECGLTLNKVSRFLSSNQSDPIEASILRNEIAKLCDGLRAFIQSVDSHAS